MAGNIHDAFFKSTFSQVEHAAGELQIMLPPALVARIDWSTLALCPGSFVDEVLSQQHTDLLFRASLAKRIAFIYVLFEHQSKVHVLMAFRLLCYMVRIWEHYLAQHPDAKRLPVIIPLVVHHGEGGWRRSVAFEDLFDIDPETFAAVAEHVPRFRFVLDDLGLAADETLRARAMTALGRVALWCLKTARTPERFADEIGRWTGLLREVRRAPHGQAALRAVLQYIFGVHDDIEPEALRALLVRAVRDEDIAEEIVTAADKLREEGRRKGERDGILKGEREGLLKGQRRTLLKVLAVRFGAVPDSVVAQVQAADVTELDLWIERVISAPTLADVFGA